MDLTIVQTSAEFKKEVMKVSFLNLLFILFYLLLMIGTLALAALCVAGAIALVSAFAHFISVMLAIGLVGLGIMLVIFVFKALIPQKAGPRSYITEVTSDTEPELYALIKKITKQTNSKFPHKIFLTSNVNAFVSYHSLFWSLFMPAKKDLYIGLGLVNALNRSEFEGVLAHEFGHFSQRSMTLGSYVYHFNQVIYQMLYNNDRYNKSLNRWGSMNNYFMLFATATAGIVNSMQWAMRKYYIVLNQSYLGLSREMEFHADAVAATVSGTAPLINALYRLEMADSCYEQLLNYYNGLISQNLRAENLYSHHFRMMLLYADKSSIPLKNGFPFLTSSTWSLYNNRIKVDDLWASHPSTQDREKALLKYHVQSLMNEEPAWSYFSDAFTLQKLATDEIYRDVAFEEMPALLDEAAFADKFTLQLHEDSLQDEYNGYYDYRSIERFSQSLNNDTIDEFSLEELFDKKYIDKVKKVGSLDEDINLLNSLIEGNTNIKSFDFDGERYQLHQANEVKDYLEKEQQMLKAEILDHDRLIYQISLAKEQQKGADEHLSRAYSRMFEVKEEVEKRLGFYNEMMTLLSPLYTTMKHDKIQQQVMKVINKDKEFKEILKEILKDDSASQNTLAEQKDMMERYVTTAHLFYNDGYEIAELEFLQQTLSAFLTITLTQNFNIKKEALRVQLELLKS